MPLVDSFGRRHTNLRISVTDRCNIRCFYCMPSEEVRFKPKRELLNFEEIARFVGVMSTLGVNKLRLTGGEPLVREGVPELVRMLSTIDGIDDVALTTNGILLDKFAQRLRDAGLGRLNVSLDALDPRKFEQITRRDDLFRVLDGIRAAQAAGFQRIKLNAVAVASLTESEVIPLARFARDEGLELRFIEFMPLDADGAWESDQVLSGAAIRAQLEQVFGALDPVAGADPSQPATDYDYRDGSGRVGFINPVSEPFCGDCNRLRITAEGRVRNCLFSTVEWDARELLRRGASDAELAALVRQAVEQKRAGHGINSDEYLQPRRPMYQIGG